MSSPLANFVVSIALEPGSLFHERYEILGLLGQGGMGVVYKAHDRSLDEVVAIKILRPDFAQDPVMAERFKTEIRLARKVRHRNVCAIHDYGEDQGLLFISMEFIEGVDLKRVLRDRGGLPPEEAYALALQVAEGLQAVHDAGIIHRDLKTPNIMRDAQATVRLMDFGIAKRFGETSLTATGNIMGTPEYMSPEQARGEKLDFRSDVYALGIVIYELFTGRVPFKGETPISTILKHLNEPPPLEESAGLPRDLRPVLGRCLAKDCAGRYSAARHVADALRAARSPLHSPAPTATTPTAKTWSGPALQARARRRRPRAGLLVVPLLALAAVVIAIRATGPDLDAEPGATASTAATLSAATVTTTPLAAPSPADVASTSRAAPIPASTNAPGPTPRPSRPTPSLRAAASQPASTLPAPSSTAAAPTPIPAPSRLEPPRPGTGWLLVVVRPWGEVSVDGQVVGSTPLERFVLPAGAHALSVRHPAYERLSRRITIHPDATERIVLDLASDGIPKR